MKLSAFTLSLACSGVSAATLAEDSLLCEAPDSIVFTKQVKEWNGAKGSRILTSAKAHVEFADLQKQTAATMSSLATKEAAIAGNRYARSARSDADKFQSDADRAQAELAPYSALVATCTASGPAGAVEVLEVKPISGIAKVRTTLNGIQLQAFVAADRLSN